MVSRAALLVEAECGAVDGAQGCEACVEGAALRRGGLPHAWT